MNLIIPGSTPNSINSTSSLSTILLQPTIGSSFTFTAGQVIEATVQQIINSVVWLKTDGQMLQARTETPLQLGQQVQLKVAEVGPMRVSLQLQNQTTSSLSNLQVMNERGIETLLASWGLEADSINLEIAQALLTHAQTLQPDDIQDIRLLWHTMSSLPQLLATDTGAMPNQLEALTFLHTHQLPVSSESLALVKSLLNDLPPFTQQLTKLQTHLDDALRQLYGAEKGNPALEQLHDTFLTARTELANWLSSSEHSSEQISKSLNQFITQIGTPPEAELASTIPNTATLSSLPLEMPEGKALLTLKADTEANLTSNPLHRLTSAISEALASQTNLDKPTTAVLHRLADQLDQFTNNLGGLHLANLSTTHNQVPEPYYFFPIPVSTPNGPGTAELKVYQQPGQHQVDPKNMRLALLLDLPTLGEIAIDLTIFERHLNGRVLSGRMETNNLVETELDELYQGLKNLGYQVDTLSCDLLKHSTFNVERSTANVQHLVFNGIDVSA